jgi:cytochrome c-type biogenesis protein CcmH/NrfG
MSLNKFRVNLIFALVVLALGITAVSSALIRLNHLAAPSSSQNQLPKNHPPVDFSKELADLEQLSAKEPENADYQARIGNIYYDMRQYDKAVVYYQKSLDLQPRNPNIETDLAACFHYLGQDDRSLDILNKVLGYRPAFPEAMFNKGIVLISGKKDVKGGISVWEDLLRSNPDYPRRAEIQQSIDQLKASLK